MNNSEVAVAENETDLKKKYAEFDNAIRSCAIRLCEKLGLTEITESEGDHGVWTFMADTLEKEIGNRCISEFSATSSNSNLVVKFRYRFNNPVVSIRRKRTNNPSETMASIELTTSYYDQWDASWDFETKRKHFHLTGGKWRLSEMMIFGGEAGLELLDVLKSHFKNELGDKVQWSASEECKVK